MGRLAGLKARDCSAQGSALGSGIASVPCAA